MKTENIIQLGGILLFIGIILIIISWFFTYPIYISEINEITFTQFYPILWPGIGISLLALFLILYYCKNKIIGALCCSLFPLILNSIQDQVFLIGIAYHKRSSYLE